MTKKYLETLNGRAIMTWTKVESQKFYDGLDLYGKDWTKISELIGTKKN